jgi:MFS-type transporter involved in bile tolerance (Atg22 family)
MRWLEGWFGTASGVLGALIVAAIALVTPVYTSSGSCISVNGGPPNCRYSQPAPTGPQFGSLIVIIVLFVLFVLIVVGTWIDLSGRRTMGRLILLISVTLLLPVWLVVSHGSFALTGTFPVALLAFVAGILACVRRDAPRVAVAPAMPAPTMMQPPSAPPQS